jgi:muramoyltetrapeptide carboxypeptidase
VRILRHHALQNAIPARTGLVTYSGPYWSTFGMRDHFEQTPGWFTSVMFGVAPITVTPASSWSDDPWFLDQDERHPIPSDGWWPVRPGSAEGRIVGGNLCTPEPAAGDLPHDVARRGDARPSSPSPAPGRT